MSSNFSQRAVFQPHFAMLPEGRGSIQGRRLEPIETILLIVGLLWLMNTFANLLVSDTNRNGGSREAGNALLEIINLSIYGGGIVFLLRSQPHRLPALLLRAWPLLLLVALTMLSAVWSDSPEASVRRSLGLILTLSFAFYISSCFELRHFLTVLLCALILYIGFGILAVAVPGQGITPDGPLAGSWRGFTGIKNEFGRILALSLTLFVVFGLTGLHWWRRVWIVGAALTFVLLILSQSKTSLVTSIGAIAGAFLCRFLFQSRFRRLRIALDIRVFMALAVLLTFAASIFVLPMIAEALGRDITLSGRTKLWAWAIDLNQSQAWLGHGYRSFWIDTNTKYFFEYFYWNGALDGGKSSTYAGPANGHNGYLDVWLEMGYVGLFALATFLFGALMRVRHCFAAGNMVAGYALATVLSFLLVYSITERIILQQTEAVWFLTMLLYLYADPSRLAARSENHEPVR